MKRYKITLKDQDEDSHLGYLIRNTELSVGAKKIDGLVKIPRYPNIKLGVESQINEVLITLTLKEIEDINGTNPRRDSFIKDRIRANLSENRINIVFVRISRSDGAGFATLMGKLDRIAEFVIDIIYSHPMVDIVTLPHIEFLKNDSPRDLVEFDNLIGSRISEIASLGYGGGKIAYFLPSYYTRDGIPKLMDDYMDRFGAEGVYICDFDGGTFSGIGYSLVSQVSRKIKNDSNTESYSLYIYSQKERKKSGAEVPSEDLLALLNGVSIVGPSHKRPTLPKDIIEKIKLKQEFNPKILNNNDFLFYQYSESPNAGDFDAWVSSAVGPMGDIQIGRKKKLAEVYNSKKTLDAVENIVSNPKETLNSLTRDEFKSNLKQIYSRMRNIR